MNGARKYWNEAMETLPLEQVRELQWLKLQRQMQYLYDHSPHFYRPKFAAAGAHPRDVRSFDDFRRLPIMRTKEMDRAAQETQRAATAILRYLPVCAAQAGRARVQPQALPASRASTPIPSTTSGSATNAGRAATARRHPAQRTVLHGFGLSMWSWHPGRPRAGGDGRASDRRWCRGRHRAHADVRA